MWEFKLSSEYIELDNLLKAMNIAPTGAQAKILILANSVKVNGVTETRVRCKLRAGDLIEAGNDTVLIV
ncbi:MAG: RNA-binding S4 domain-containing protein [Candidatus Omnitrophota bacterium]